MALYRMLPQTSSKYYPFFDEERTITIAVLSHRLSPFTAILDGREKEGSAIRKSLLYYELQGYLRENLSQLQRNHERGGLGPHLVNVAMGALKKSDNVQKRKSEAAHQAHQQAIVPFDRLEEVLDIARLVRLGDDLDVMSIYSLRLASKSLGLIAARMARHRMQQTQLTVCPLVDGCSLSGGFSVFRRVNTELQSIIFKMSRNQKVVEYGQCESIICCHAPPAPRGCDEDKKDKAGIYRPVERSCKEFAWNCEETSFATLDREWGDIVVHEYLGQKLVLTWHMGAADTMMMQNATSLSKSTASSSGERAPLAALPLDANLLIGSRLWELPLLYFKLDVVESDTHKTDDVTVFYKGRIRVEEIGISFLCMVQSFAKSLEPVVRERLKQIQETRPLLEHEHAYLEQVFELSAMQA